MQTDVTYGECANCGSGDHLRNHMVIASDHGGRDVPSNHMLLCRSCEYALKMTRKKPQDFSRAVGIHISRDLHKRLTEHPTLAAKKMSMSSLVQMLIDSYLDNIDNYSDLEMYQDSGADVRVNLWISDNTFHRLKRVVRDLKGTVTGTVKSLVMMYVTMNEQGGNNV